MGGNRFCPVRRCGEVPVRAVRQRVDASLSGQHVREQRTQSGTTVPGAGEGVAGWRLPFPFDECRPKAQASSSTVASRLASVPSSRRLTKVYASALRLSVKYSIPRLTALEKT